MSCLLLYVVSPFLHKNNVNGKRHQAFVQVVELARIIGEFGYNVDVIQFDNTSAKIGGGYNLIVDLNPGLNDVYFDKMSSNCKRICYFTGSENTFAYEAEKKRIENLKIRKDVDLPVVLDIPKVSKAVEHFDGVFFIGNKYNLQTFKDYNLPKVFLLNNTGYEFNIGFDEKKKKSNEFIYFSSQGNVHRGLDLLLDVFGQKNFPAELYICGPVENEEDFCDAYRYELYNCRNIHLIGFIDITSEVFKELVSKCAYTILPSCSEGQSGSVLTMMSAGVIPICSKECGFDDDDVINMPDCAIETIDSYIRAYSEKSIAWCRAEAEKAIKLTKTKFSLDVYKDSVRKGLKEILNNK